jgi:hypothetical protein
VAEAIETGSEVIRTFLCRLLMTSTNGLATKDAPMSRHELPEKFVADLYPCCDGKEGFRPRARGFALSSPPPISIQYLVVLPRRSRPNGENRMCTPENCLIRAYARYLFCLRAEAGGVRFVSGSLRLREPMLSDLLLGSHSSIEGFAAIASKATCMRIDTTGYQSTRLASRTGGQ